MPKVLIVVEASSAEIAQPTTERMVSALKQAISRSSSASTLTPVSVETIAANTLAHIDREDLESQEIILCPLTLNLPNMPFPSESIYRACRDVSKLRQRLVQQQSITVGDGNLWLPVVLTAKGPLYGEVIRLAGNLARVKMPDNSSCDLSYYQPFHLSDARRQELYQLGHYLMQLLSAPPATYLMQFAFHESGICFDRLWPFPAAPAIASLGVQEPDLFTCHWYCLNTLPIVDLTIIPAVTDRALF